MSEPDPSPVGARTFVLGLGAQKAGTTWLFKHLHGSRGFVSGYLKEMHVLDIAFVQGQDRTRRRLAQLATEQAERVEQGAAADARHLHRLAMVADPRLYFDYYAYRLSRRGVVATGDFTPAHSMLSAEHLARIRAEFDKRGVRTVAVFMMRDPVERVWSHVRMKAHREPNRFPDGPLPEFEARFGWEHYAARTQYHETLTAIAHAFPSEDVHVGLYETLVGDATQVHRIAALAGLEARDPEVETTLNASPRSQLPEDLIRTVAMHYAEVYREVARLRPELDIAGHWPASRFALGRSTSDDADPALGLS